MKKQTAVESLIEQFYNNEGMITTKQLEKAKAIEKEQIIDAATWGALHESAEQYYTSTYE